MLLKDISFIFSKFSFLGEFNGKLLLFFSEFFSFLLQLDFQLLDFSLQHQYLFFQVFVLILLEVKFVASFYLI